MRGTIALAVLAGLISLGGCINTQAETPEWFAQRSAENDDAYPSLRSVPRTNDANTDQAHWDALEADLVAAGQEVRSNPRSAPASQAEQPEEFLEEAQQDLEQARQSHTP
jgi:hypothetical protein